MASVFVCQESRAVGRPGSRSWIRGPGPGGFRRGPACPRPSRLRGCHRRPGSAAAGYPAPRRWTHGAWSPACTGRRLRPAGGMNSLPRPGKWWSRQRSGAVRSEIRGSHPQTAGFPARRPGPEPDRPAGRERKRTLCSRHQARMRSDSSAERSEGTQDQPPMAAPTKNEVAATGLGTTPRGCH